MHSPAIIEKMLKNGLNLNQVCFELKAGVETTVSTLWKGENSTEISSAQIYTHKILITM